MPDLALLLMRHGYHAVARDRADRGGADTYVSRFLGRRTVVLGDADGARAFYDESLASRAGAVPPPLAWLLFGRGAVHGTDGSTHRDRKRLFLDVLDPTTLPPLLEEVCRQLEDASASWAGREVHLHRELGRIYGRAVLRWAGIELPPAEEDAVSARLAAIVDGFGFAPAAYVRAWWARLRADRWAERLVLDAREGRAEPASGTALERFARADQLDARSAGVELLNVLRPTVAVSWLGSFAALALAATPGEHRARLREDDAELERHAFVQEVRRTSPFVPVLTARAVRAEEVARVRVRPGDRLVLDVIGIDHHARRWPDPHTFRPDRLLHEDTAHAPSAYDLVPQGGGHLSGHRCPGEALTLALLSETVRVLAGLDLHVPDPRVDATRMPTLPGGRALVRVGGAPAPAA
ncbi:MAG TPA: cytochrome P450 [Nocardioides sp.]|nr:cytochrome P450 [Nocardioides sp.]